MVLGFFEADCEKWPDIKIRLKASYVLEVIWPVIGFPNAADRRAHPPFPLAGPL